MRSRPSYAGRCLLERAARGAAHLRDAIAYRSWYTPADFTRDYHCHRGSIFRAVGARRSDRVPTHVRAALLRYPGLYLIRRRLQPGGGVPWLFSAASAGRSRLVQRDRADGRWRSIAFALDVTAVIPERRRGVFVRGARARSSRRSRRARTRMSPRRRVALARREAIEAAGDAPLVSLLVPARDGRNDPDRASGMLAQLGFVARCCCSTTARARRDARDRTRCSTHAAWDAKLPRPAAARATSCVPRRRRSRHVCSKDARCRKAGAAKVLRVPAARGRGAAAVAALPRCRHAPRGPMQWCGRSRPAHAADVDFSPPRYVGDLAGRTGSSCRGSTTSPHRAGAAARVPRVRASHCGCRFRTGQAMLVRRDAYARLGGHAAVRDRIVGT